MAVQLGALKGSDGAFQHYYVPGSEQYEKLTRIRLACLSGKPSAIQQALDEASEPVIPLSLGDLSKLSRAGIQGAKAGAAFAKSLESVPEPADWLWASRLLVAIVCSVAHGIVCVVVAVGLATIVKWIAGLF